MRRISSYEEWGPQWQSTTKPVVGYVVNPPYTVKQAYSTREHASHSLPSFLGFPAPRWHFLLSKWERNMGSDNFHPSLGGSEKV